MSTIRLRCASGPEEVSTHGCPRQGSRGWSVALFVAVLFCGLDARSAPQPSVLKQVEGAIMCICPDDCGKVLINCTCSDSDRYRRQIRAMIDQGMTAEQIIDRFVAEKGKIVLAAPTTKGFDLTAWVLPFVALGVSIPIVAVVIRRLGSRAASPNGERSDTPTQPGEQVDPTLADRLERELRNLDR